MFVALRFTVHDSVHASCICMSVLYIHGMRMQLECARSGKMDDGQRAAVEISVSLLHV